MTADVPVEAAWCPACGSDAVTSVGEVEGYRRGTHFAVAECDACATQFVLDRTVPDDLYDAIYERGEILPGYHRYWGYAEAVERLRWPLHYLACAEEMYWGVEQVMAARRRARGGTRLLEVGSGLGYLTAAARKAGYQAQGVDLSTRAVADARARFGPWYEVEDAADVQRSEDPFDVVVALELIEHLPDPLGFLEPQVRALRPGGVIVVSTPDKGRHPAGARWQTELPPVHLHWFTRAGFEALAARAGGTVEFLDLTGFNEIAPGQSTPPPVGTPPPPSVLDEDLEVLQVRPRPQFPSLRDRAVRYPFTTPVLKVARRIRRRRSGGVAPLAGANSFVAIVRRAEEAAG